MELNTAPDTLHKPAENSPLSQEQLKALETAMPMWKLTIRQFLQHRMAVAGSLIILFFILIAISADLISMATGIDPLQQNVGARYLMPFSRAEYASDVRETAVDRWMKNHADAALALQNKLIALGTQSARPEDTLYDVANLPSAEAQELLGKAQADESVSEAAKGFRKLVGTFSTLHIFGTDEVGRDVFMRLVYGTRVSMSVGILVAIASAFLGLLIGAIAGFYGGAVDAVFMRFTDSLQSLPTIPILLVFAAIDFQKLPGINTLVSSGNESIIKMIIILCIFSWMSVGYLVRGSILSLREREFVLAAKTVGAKNSTIIFRHMFPNVIAPIVVSITLGVGESIIFESVLSFLGLGIMPPTASWGNMLNNAQEVIYKNVWLTILPGLMILLVTVSFNFMGDGLQDAIDPKSIRR